MRSTLAGIEVANGGNRGRKESGANGDHCLHIEAKDMVAHRNSVKFSVSSFHHLQNHIL